MPEAASASWAAQAEAVVVWALLLPQPWAQRCGDGECPRSKHQPAPSSRKAQGAHSTPGSEEDASRPLFGCAATVFGCRGPDPPYALISFVTRNGLKHGLSLRPGWHFS